MPRPRKTETPSGSQVPRPPGIWASGRPSRRPISRPMSSPRTAATNSGRRELLDATDQPRGRDDRQVRQDGEADDDPGDRPGGEDERRRPANLLEEPGPGRRQAEPDEAAEGGAKDTDGSNHGRFSLASGLTRWRRGAQRGGAARDRQRRPDGIAASRGPPGGHGSVAIGSGRSVSAAAIASRSVATAWTAIPGIVRRGAARRGHDRPGEPEARGLAQAPLEPDHGPQLTEQPDLADRHGAGRADDRVATRRGRAPGAGPGRARRPRARRRGWRRRRGSRGRSPARRPRTATSRARRFGSTPDVRRAGVAGGRGDQRLDLDEERPAALQGRRDDASRRRAAVIGEEGAGGVGDLEQAGLGHLEDADLVGGSEAVLGGAQEPQRARALALEVQDRVDEVLERLGTRRSSRPWSRGRRGPRRSRRPWPAPSAAASIRGPGRRSRPPRRAPRRWRSGPSRRSRAPGRSARGELGDPPDLTVSASTRIASPRRPVEQAQAGGPEADLARRLLAGGVQDAPRPARPAAPRRRPPGAGAWTCRCPARRRAGPASPATRPPPRTRSSSPMPTAGAHGAASANRGAAGRERPAPADGRRRADAATVRGRRSRRACSTRRRSGTGPPSAGTAAPQDWQT